MKKNILNLGKALNKAEQKSINGGDFLGCYSNSEICSGCPTDCRACVKNGIIYGWQCTPPQYE